MRLKRKKHSKKKLLISITMFLFIFLLFKYLDKKEDINVSNKVNNFLLEEEFSNKTITNRLSELIKEEKQVDIEEPLIYIYSTHDREEYKSNNLFQFRPNVTMVSYILEEQFNNKFKTIVENRSIGEILDNNNWNYSYSYLASREYIDDIRNRFNSIKYFIDVHRDSLPHDRTTISINNKDYASILFIVGLENENYESNLEFTELIHNRLNEKYPNISKGILKKSGPGVNGLYNQDISPNSILVEFGGEENTTYEVLNTALAFSDVYMEILNERET